MRVFSENSGYRDNYSIAVHRNAYSPYTAGVVFGYSADASAYSPRICAYLPEIAFSTSAVLLCNRLRPDKNIFIFGGSFYFQKGSFVYESCYSGGSEIFQRDTEGCFQDVTFR